MQTATVADGTKVTMAGHELVFGQNIFMPRDANDIADDMAALHARIEEDGYLLIRDFYDRDAIMAARSDILSYLSAQGLLDPDALPQEGVISPKNEGAVIRNEVVVNMHAYLRVVNSERIMAFFENFLGGPTLTLDHKWPRAVRRGHSTGAHYDVVFMGAGTKKLYTVWTPLDDLSLEMGPLAFCPGSNKLDALRRRIRASTMAERALISRTTLHKIERGDAGVSMGMYATVLFVLGMHDGISALADRSRDGIGLDLLEERLPQRVRVPSAARRRDNTRRPGAGDLGAE